MSAPLFTPALTGQTLQQIAQKAAMYDWLIEQAKEDGITIRHGWHGSLIFTRGTDVEVTQ